MKRTAMTLAETLLAMAIVSMLMAACLRVISVLNRTSGIIGQRDSELILDAGLKNLLAADLVHARRYKFDGEDFVLDSVSSLDNTTLKLVHLRSVVRYQLKKIQGRKCLMRIQDTPSGRQRGVVCFGVKKFDLGLTDTIVATDAWQEMPQLVSINVALDGMDEKILTYDFVTR